MKKKLLLILLLFPLISIGQNLEGIVLSANDEPIDDVNVFALDSKTRAITNKKGKFSLQVLPKFKNDEILEFSHVGYTTKRLSISYLKSHDYKIILNEDVQNLSGVTIAANKKLEKKLSFKKLNSMKNDISAFGSFLKDDKLYVIGGDSSNETDAFEKFRSKRADADLLNFLQSGREDNILFYRRDLCIYDFKTDTWEIKKLKLKKRAYHNIHYFDNSIYILGGKEIKMNIKTDGNTYVWEYIQDKIEVLNINDQAIQVDNTNPHQAANFASFSYKDNIIVMGGYLRTGKKGVKDFTSKIHLYNITSGYWYELGNLPTPRETTGILIDDKIYIIGGNDGKPIAKIQSFDLNTEIWETEAELFSGLERPAITYHENIIYFFEDRKMFTYDLKAKQLKEYEIDLSLKYSSMYYYDNKLYIFGGRVETAYSKIPSSKVFNIDLENFKNTKPVRTKNFEKEITLAKATE